MVRSKYEFAQKTLKDVLPPIAGLSFVIGMATGGLSNMPSINERNNSPVATRTDYLNNMEDIAPFEFHDPRLNLTLVQNAGKIIARSVEERPAHN
jgi:hypothetical protein